MQRATLALLLALFPLQAAALDTDELLGLVAMPLAVAAVSNATGVPAGELSALVSTLNRANVPPTQVVQVVRYAPVVLVVDDEPDFVAYLRDEVDRGVTGTRLVTAIEQRLRTYGVEPQFVVLEQPATAFVLSDDYMTPVIRDTNDLLAAIAMPLAVAAVAELSGLPLSELTSLVATLNQADVPPVQVIEVLRYAPVALLAEDGGPQFVQFVQRQVVDEKLTGLRLVRVIEQRLRTYDVRPQIALSPTTTVTVVDQNFFPPSVRTQVAERSGHRHGGPPGQLKRQAGVQTGAEIVHGEHPAARVVPRRRPEVGRGGPAMAPAGPPQGAGPGAGPGKGKGKGKG